jgi:hypothetical protein
MLIYHSKSTEEGKTINCVEVSMGFGRTNATTHKNVQMSMVVEEHKPFIEMLINRDDIIFVTGNSSTVGNGVFLDNLYTEYTKIESKYPDLFCPLNPDFVPGREEIDQKYRKKELACITELRKTRYDNIKEGKDFLSNDDIMDLGDKRGIELRGEADKEKEKLKSYKEMGVIVTPTKIESYPKEIKSSPEMSGEGKAENSTIEAKI